ncbi:hypothetical protein, partial [Paracoccus limosus]|uniref:hypothetical protein n=1 Tax=Paracoccus limosus TaxID=913252 RepID=UPI001B881E8C
SSSRSGKRTVCPRATPSMNPDMPIPQRHAKVYHKTEFLHRLGPLIYRGAFPTCNESQAHGKGGRRRRHNWREQIIGILQEDNRRIRRRRKMR